MSCCNGRKREVQMKAEEKWDYINLADFRSNSCLTGFSYGILWISLFISISVYAVDVFTAINLLVFNRWSGEVKPFIPFRISKWIFSGCIILSWLILIFEWTRAIRVMKRGGVAESYLDPLAVRVQSFRMGKRGQGWRRFLVFAELTKSKKGTEYIALFTYFSFKAWARIIFAEAPRQVINGLTLYSVIKANLIPVGEHAAPQGHSPIIQFFINFRILAQQSRNQAFIIGGMTWTLLIFIISALNLFVALVLYLVFLWHHIPDADGGLAGYLTRKIDRRVGRIVQAKVQKGLEKENAKRALEEAKAAKAGRPLGPKREATLPMLDVFGDVEKMGEKPGLSRQTTSATLPVYSANDPNSIEMQPTVPDIAAGFLGDNSRPVPSRTGTANSMVSTATYASNAPLMGNSGGTPYGPPGSIRGPDRTQSPMAQGPSGGFRGPPGQGDYGDDQGFYAHGIPPAGTMPRSGTPNGSQRLPNFSRQNTNASDYMGRQNSPPIDPYNNDPMGRRTPGAPNRMGSDSFGRRTPGGPPPRSDSNRNRTPAPIDLYTGRAAPEPVDFSTGRAGPAPIDLSAGRAVPTPAPQDPYARRTPAPIDLSSGRATPAGPGGLSGPPPPMRSRSAAPSNAYNPPTNRPPPNRNMTAPLPALSQGNNFMPPPQQQSQPPRSTTAPPRDYFPPNPTGRSGTAPPTSRAPPPPQQHRGYDDIYDSYSGRNEPPRRMQPPARSATAGPGNAAGGWGKPPPRPQPPQQGGWDGYGGGGGGYGAGRGGF